MMVLGIQALPANITLDKRQITQNSWDFSRDKVWGVNLGNWLVLEKWMMESMFKDTGAQDEWTFSANVPDAKNKLEQHWKTYVTEEDFKKLAQVHVNHVRIPVGYWAFLQPDKGEPYIFGSQKDQLVRILGYCATYKIKAIIDLHGLPGSQNGKDHSGHSDRTNFYSNYNIERGLRLVQEVVNWINSLDDRSKQQISAIEAANEPDVSSDDYIQQLKSYYERAYSIINASPYHLSMIFGAGFSGFEKWESFLQGKNNVVLDKHIYRNHDQPPTKTDTDIIKKLCEEGNAPFHLPILFGEWSAISNIQSKTDDWLRKYMDTQMAIYQQKAGAIMWSLKVEKSSTNDNKEWSFVDLINGGIINENTFSKHPAAVAC
ncbi:glycoside hydrolase superfamily [Cunninghamella echinulata]|nr:glycoside hydrolase superfamily [Cunninghamella echinulata]